MWKEVFRVVVYIGAGIAAVELMNQNDKLREENRRLRGEPKNR